MANNQYYDLNLSRWPQRRQQVVAARPEGNTASTSSVDSVSARVTILEGYDLNARVSALEGYDIDTRLTIAEGEIDTLQAQVADLISRVEALENP